jgi:hypothetical protein
MSGNDAFISGATRAQGGEVLPRVRGDDLTPASAKEETLSPDTYATWVQPRPSWGPG